MFMLREKYFESKRYQPLPYLSCSIEQFAKEWDLCYLNTDKPTDRLFGYLHGTVEHWVRMLTDPHYDKDISYCALLFKISSQDPLGALSAWTHAQGSSLAAFLYEEWFYLLRKPPFRIKKIPSQFCFVLARLFVFRLSNAINAWLHHTKKTSVTYLVGDMDSFPAQEEDYELNDMMIDLSTSNPYAYYLFTLYLNDLTRDDINSITRTTTSYVYLWRLINAESNKRGLDQQRECQLSTGVS